MKIAIVRPSSAVIAFDSYNCQEIGLAKSLLSYGVSTDIYMAGNVTTVKYTEAAATDHNKVTVIQLPFIRLPGQQSILRGLFRHLKTETYDLIQTHEDSQVLSVLVSLFGKKHTIPVVLCQGMYLNYSGKIKRALQWAFDQSLGRILINNVDLCLAKTNAAKRYLIHKGFRSEPHICSIGVDISPFENAPNIDWKTTLGISADVHLLLYVGKVEKRRNVDFLIHLLATLNQSRALHMIIVGNGPELQQCKALSIARGVENHITFIERLSQAELASLFAQSFCFLLPSNYEIYGMVILEAMFHGIPVISTNSAGAQDIISDGVDGYIIDGLDPAAWAYRIDKMLEAPDTTKIMGLAATNKIQSRFTWDVAGRCFYEKYMYLLNSPHS